jgi:hypothetical protein
MSEEYRTKVSFTVLTELSCSLTSELRPGRHLLLLQWSIRNGSTLDPTFEIKSRYETSGLKDLVHMLGLSGCRGSIRYRSGII